MPVTEIAAGQPIANGADEVRERPYFERTEDGATVYLVKPYNGKDTVLAVRDMLAQDFISARTAAKTDEEQLYAHLIAAITGIPRSEIGKLYLRDYVVLRQVVDILGGF